MLECCSLIAFLWGAAGILLFCCKQTHLAEIDPCVTQTFPLGDPEFSTGSPKLFLGSRKGLTGPARVGKLHDVARKPGATNYLRFGRGSNFLCPSRVSATR